MEDKSNCQEKNKQKEINVPLVKNEGHDGGLGGMSIVVIRQAGSETKFGRH